MTNLIYIIPAGIALFWIVRIFLLKNVSRAQLFIISGMLMALITLFGEPSFSLFMFPLFYLGIRTRTDGGTGKWDWLVFLPSIILAPFTDSLVFSIFLPVQIAVITIWAIVHINRYGKKLAELYDVNEVSAEDISQTMIFIIFSVITTAIIVMLPDFVTSSTPVQLVLAAFTAILQYYVGYHTYRIRETPPILPAPAEDIADDDAGHHAKPAASSDEILLKSVEDEKLYLDPSLSLVSLAEKLHTNRTYLSSSIHNCKGQNFSDYINTLRINHFISIVREGDETAIKDAAFNSGYSNIQSFYRNFTEIMQMTPKTWISHNKKI